MRAMWAALVVAGALPRGVQPGDERFGRPDGFSCSGTVVPHSAVNDDFCDCADGSDEPGTSACAGLGDSHFFCVNEQAMSRFVYASRVNDGVCDCCDGSDEWAPSHCANTCEQDGRVHREHVVKRKEELLRGLAARKKHVEAAPGMLAEWRSEVDRLQAREENLKADLEKTRAELADAEAKVKDVEPQADEKADAADAAAAEAMEEAEDPGDEADAKPVSEYAKWMDEEGKKEAGVEGANEPVSEYAKWMDGEGRKETGLEDDTLRTGEAEQKGTIERIKDAAAGAVEAVKSAFDGRSPEQKQRDVFKDQVSELEREQGDGAERVRLLEDHLSRDWGPENAFIMMHEKKCLKQKFGEYDYHICFLDRAEQGHTDLGSFTSFEQGVMQFEGGTSCPGGIQRSMTVTFKCGEETRMLNVGEPSMCVYKADVTHPGACTEEGLRDLTSTQPKHPSEL